jgi:hypothetical protein
MNDPDKQPKISEQMLAAIVSEIERYGLSENTLSTLRGSFPDVYFTYCMDDDIHDGKPVIRRPMFNIYLVGGGEHCISLTSNYSQAKGIVIAEIIEDGD